MTQQFNARASGERQTLNPSKPARSADDNPVLRPVRMPSSLVEKAVSTQEPLETEEAEETEETEEIDADPPQNNPPPPPGKGEIKDEVKTAAVLPSAASSVSTFEDFAALGQQPLTVAEGYEVRKAPDDPSLLICANCGYPYGMFITDPLTGRVVHKVLNDCVVNRGGVIPASAY